MVVAQNFSKGMCFSLESLPVWKMGKQVLSIFSTTRKWVLGLPNLLFYEAKGASKWLSWPALQGILNFERTANLEWLAHLVGNEFRIRVSEIFFWRYRQMIIFWMSLIIFRR